MDRIPFGYAFNFDNYLFNKIKHINTQGIDLRADYFVINNVKKRIEAKIHFSIRNGHAYSPYKSLFGSFEFNPRLHPNLLLEFWTYIENDLKARGITTISITNFAACYSPKKADTIQNVLSKANFSISNKAVNHHIHVSDRPLETVMHPMEIRRLNKCKKNNFSFRKETKDSALEIYEYLMECREEQGLNLSITRETLLDYINRFPGDYSIFSVRSDKRLLAATITVRVHRKILYNFLPGSLKKFKHFSPTVMLLEGLYQYCQKNNFEILDLGISTKSDGKDQPTLIKFKENMGGEKGYKYFFKKHL